MKMTTQVNSSMQTLIQVNSSMQTLIQKFRMEKSVHAVVETCSVSINTEPYEPLKEEFQRMKKEYELLQLRDSLSKCFWHRL
jgi:hypothetical protein